MLYVPVVCIVPFDSVGPSCQEWDLEGELLAFGLGQGPHGCPRKLQQVHWKGYPVLSLHLTEDWRRRAERQKEVAEGGAGPAPMLLRGLM